VASPEPNPVEGTTTPPAASAPSLSMDLNMVSLSYTEIFDGTITATLLVERDGSHALPVRVESNVAPSFTAEVIDVLSETAITPGKVKGRPVRSLLEVTIVCSGVKTAGGRTEQGIRIAQRAPVPVPEADQIAKDTVTVPGRTSEMVEQETIIYDQIEAPAPITERTIVDKPVPPTSSEEMIDPVEERVVTREVGASYDPDELSRLMAFPEGTAERGREEYVVLSVHVTPDGQTGVIEVLAGSWEPLEAPAIEAVSRLRFQPATVDGNPVESTLVITLRYTP
jgi:TonB family protein